jgi:hypothetical protein
LYEDLLRKAGQFDTDDVVISAASQLDTPIWRRRRTREGFDYISLDETHLFNINELQIIHFLTKTPGSAPISLAIDKAQAVGDRGWSETNLIASGAMGNDSTDTIYNAVFRSSSDIIDFSASILASGVALFSDFTNTLTHSQSGLSDTQEKISQPLVLYEVSDDTAMIELAFQRAAALQKLTKSSPWEVLITSLSEALIEKINTFSKSNNKAVTFLDRRGDYSRVKDAEKSGHLIVGHADFVGGLEFNVVIIVGVDKGRVPLETGSVGSESRSFQKYVAHNRLYVASSRARLALEFMGLAGRGPSDLLKPALDSELLNRQIS